MNKNDIYLKSFYEYVIREYPIKRTNFVDFTYSDISFYSADNLKDCYFSNLILKDDLSSFDICIFKVIVLYNISAKIPPVNPTSNIFFL